VCSSDLDGGGAFLFIQAGAGGTDVSLPARFEKQSAYLDEHQKQSAYLDEHPYVGVVSANIHYSDKKHPTKHPDMNTIQTEIKTALINEYCYVAHPCAMIRKSVLIDNAVKKEVEPKEIS
jgi:hypothetical protein